MRRVSGRCLGRSRRARRGRFRPSPERPRSRPRAARRRCAVGSRGSARDGWRSGRGGTRSAAISRRPGRPGARRADLRDRRRPHTRRRAGRAPASSPERPANGPPPRRGRPRREHRASPSGPAIADSTAASRTCRRGASSRSDRRVRYRISPRGRTASAIDRPWPCRTSTCRSFSTISSGLSRLPAILWSS